MTRHPALETLESGRKYPAGFLLFFLIWFCVCAFSSGDVPAVTRGGGARKASSFVSGSKISRCGDAPKTKISFRGACYRNVRQDDESAAGSPPLCVFAPPSFFEETFWIPAVLPGNDFTDGTFPFRYSILLSKCLPVRAGPGNAAA